MTQVLSLAWDLPNARAQPPQSPPKTTMQIICVLSYGVVSKIYLFFFFFGLFAFSRAAPMAHGGSQDRGLIGAVDAGLCHSHSNAGSEQCLQPTPQLTATLDP